jgi:hypothetical protein
MEQHRSPTRRLRIFLRDFRLVEAAVHLAGGQSLASFFVNRKLYLNLREAFWTGTGDRVEHAVLKVEQVLWVASTDSDIPLSHASTAIPGRIVEVQLDGGLLLRGRLIINHQQRLLDYLETSGRFVPMLGAQLLRSGRPPKRVNVHLGDIVLNQDGIQAAWETADQSAGGTPVEAAEEAPAPNTGKASAAPQEPADPPAAQPKDEQRPRW